MNTVKYPRVITEDIKKFKFALKVETVQKIAALSEEWGYPNVSEAVDDILVRYVDMVDHI
jgi:hypothetical protein